MQAFRSQQHSEIFSGEFGRSFGATVLACIHTLRQNQVKLRVSVCIALAIISKPVRFRVGFGGVSGGVRGGTGGGAPNPPS
jgi:hypothetical protein